MSEDRPETAKDAARREREARLAAALRANLRRRKAASRALRESDAPIAAETDAAPPRSDKSLE